MSLFLQIAVQDPGGVAVAREAGVDEIELCTGLGLGGLTPSLGLIRVGVASGVATHVLIRPRASGFTYSDAEQDLIVADVITAAQAGAAGVAVGGCRDGRVDVSFMRRVVEDSPVPVTFHRAFDTIPDRRRAIDDLVDLGVTRILTSGGASSAADAVDELARIVEWADGRIQILAGGGVTAGLVSRLARAGVDGVHASASVAVTDPVPVTLGADSRADSPTRRATDPALVQNLLRAVISARVTPPPAAPGGFAGVRRTRRSRWPR